MIVNFIKCSTSFLRIHKEAVHNNDAVNVSHCKAMVKSDRVFYLGGEQLPSISFIGTGIEWVFNSEKERDSEIERILSSFSPKLNGDNHQLITELKEWKADAIERIAELELENTELRKSLKELLA